MKTVLLTGGTGVLGKHLTRELLKYNDIRLILLVRGESDDAARTRIKEHSEIPDHTEVYAADLSKTHLGLSEGRYQDLKERVTDILHSAASTRFNSSLEEARANNVETTKRTLDFARDCPHLVRFGYLSTAFVAGKRMGIIKEDEFEHDAGFNNTYQQSKYEAEALVRASGLPIVIFRPPFVYSVEETKRQESKKNFLTLLVTLVVGGHIPFIPGTKESVMDIVTATDTARVICQLFLKDSLSHMTYHITNGTNGPTIDHFHRIMEEEKGTSIPLEYCGEGDEGMQKVREKAQQEHHLQTTYQRAETFLAEPGYSKVFDNAHTLFELNTKQIGKNPASVLQVAVHNAIWNSSK